MHAVQQQPLTVKASSHNFTRCFFLHFRSPTFAFSFFCCKPHRSSPTRSTLCTSLPAFFFLSTLPPQQFTHPVAALIIVSSLPFLLIVPSLPRHHRPSASCPVRCQSLAVTVIGFLVQPFPASVTGSVIIGCCLRRRHCFCPKPCSRKPSQLVSIVSYHRQPRLDVGISFSALPCQATVQSLPCCRPKLPKLSCSAAVSSLFPSSASSLLWFPSAHGSFCLVFHLVIAGRHLSCSAQATLGSLAPVHVQVSLPWLPSIDAGSSHSLPAATVSVSHCYGCNDAAINAFHA